MQPDERKLLIAQYAEIRRTMSRALGNTWCLWSTRSPGPATAMCTVPTGFASDPPPGPAIPVTPMP